MKIQVNNNSTPKGYLSVENLLQGILYQEAGCPNVVYTPVDTYHGITDGSYVPILAINYAESKELRVYRPRALKSLKFTRFYGDVTLSSS